MIFLTKSSYLDGFLASSGQARGWIIHPMRSEMFPHGNQYTCVLAIFTLKCLYHKKEKAVMWPRTWYLYCLLRIRCVYPHSSQFLRPPDGWSSREGLLHGGPTRVDRQMQN